MPEEDGEALEVRWEHEASTLELLDDLKERLIDGQFTTQKEKKCLIFTAPAQRLRATG